MPGIGEERPAGERQPVPIAPPPAPGPSPHNDDPDDAQEDVEDHRYPPGRRMRYQHEYRAYQCEHTDRRAFGAGCVSVSKGSPGFRLNAMMMRMMMAHGACKAGAQGYEGIGVRVIAVVAMMPIAKRMQVSASPGRPSQGGPAFREQNLDECAIGTLMLQTVWMVRTNIVHGMAIPSDGRKP